VAPEARRSYGVWAVYGMLPLAVALIFVQTAGHDFVNFDDSEYVYKNPHVLSGLTKAGVIWAFTRCDVSAHWHPLTLLSLMADVELLKAKEGPPDLARLAAWMHLENAALHAANVLLVFLLLRTMTGRLWPSALAAALFAVHPTHVESVAWITERKDVLSGLFGLLALWAYAWYARRPSVGRYLAVAAALALGLMCKPMLVTWPFLFLLLDYWPLQRMSDGPVVLRSRLRRLLVLIVEKAPLLLLVAISAVITYEAQTSHGAVASLESVPTSARIARAAVVYVAYLGKSLWPTNLAAIYPIGPVQESGTVLGAAVVLTLLTAGAIWASRRARRAPQRWLVVGWFWYLGTLAPTIGFVQAGVEVMADRFLYLPQIGLCIAVTWTAAQWVAGKKGTVPICRNGPKGASHKWGLSPFSPRRSFAIVAALVLTVWTALAWKQASYWRNSQRLWTHTLACTTNNAYAHYSFGIFLADRGQVDEGLDHLLKALAISPKAPQVSLNIGIILAHRGQLDGALTYFQKAVDFGPDYAEAHNNLGAALAARGKFNDAIDHYHKALASEPEHAEARNNLGAALANLGRFDDAIVEFKRAATIRPDYLDARDNLGEALARRGRTAEALEQFQKALSLAAAQNKTDKANSVREKIRSYQSGRTP